MTKQINIKPAHGAVAAPTGYVFVRLHSLLDTKYHTLTPVVADNEINSLANSTEASADTIAQGLLIEGRFTTVRIHSGHVRAYCEK